MPILTSQRINILFGKRWQLAHLITLRHISNVDQLADIFTKLCLPDFCISRAVPNSLRVDVKDISTVALPTYNGQVNFELIKSVLLVSIYEVTDSSECRLRVSGEG